MNPFLIGLAIAATITAIYQGAKILLHILMLRSLEHLDAAMTAASLMELHPDLDDEYRRLTETEA